MVESLVSQVGAGAGNPQTEGGSEAENASSWKNHCNHA